MFYSQQDTINPDEDIFENGSSDDETLVNDYVLHEGGYSEDQNLISLIDERSEITPSEIRIPQFDGNMSESGEDDQIVNKTMYSINCEMSEIIQVITFFRSFDFYWKYLENHKVCEPNKSAENCFLCHMRSSCLRLNNQRSKGPRSLKIIEFTSQLNLFKSTLGWNWTKNAGDFPSFLENTLRLVAKFEPESSSLFGLPSVQCNKCHEERNFPKKLIFEVDTRKLLNEEIVDVKDLLTILFKGISRKKCCEPNMHFLDSDMKCIIFKLSNPLTMKILDSEEMFGRNLIYKSHGTEDVINGVVSHSSMFNLNGKSYYQNKDGDICESVEIIKEKVKMVSFLITDKEKKQTKFDQNKFVFGNQIQKQLYKQYQSILSPEKHSEKRLRDQDYEKERSNDPKRKEYKKSIDQERDKIRDQTDERRKMHTVVDKKGTNFVIKLMIEYKCTKLLIKKGTNFVIKPMIE